MMVAPCQACTGPSLHTQPHPRHAFPQHTTHPPTPRHTPQVAGVTDAGLKPRPVRKLAVLGGGLMGSGIATAAVLSGINVLLKEVNQQFLDVSVGGSPVPKVSS